MQAIAYAHHSSDTILYLNPLITALTFPLIISFKTIPHHNTRMVYTHHNHNIFSKKMDLSYVCVCYVSERVTNYFTDKTQDKLNAKVISYE